MSNEIIIRSIKIVDIAFIGIIYFTLAILISVLLDNYIGEFNPKKADNKSTFRLICEIYANLSVITISAYILRNIVDIIPFPLDGVSGFSHSKVKELSGGIVYGFALFYYQNNLRAKIQYVINRFTNARSDKKLVTFDLLNL